MRLISTVKTMGAALVLTTAFGWFAPAGTVAGQEAKPEKDKTASSSAPDYVDDFAKVRFSKPNRDWSLVSNGPEAIHRVLCSRSESDQWSPRFALIVMPSVGMPDGMETRLRQIKMTYADTKQEKPLTDLKANEIQSSRFHLTKFEKAVIGGKEATMLVYDLDEEKPYRAIEYGLFYNDNFYLIQAAAPVSEWEKPELTAMFERAFKSFTFLKVGK
jgi:hypothetical protein